MDGSLIPAGNSARHQRAAGALRLAVKAESPSAATRLAELYHAHPLRALFPRPSNGDPFTAAMATVSGGLAGGDTVEIDIRVGAGADLLLVSQAAEKVYRSIDRQETGLDIQMVVEDGGTLELLPRETILFDGARQLRNTRLSLETAASRALAGDLTVFGRGAMGERFLSGRARDRWAVDMDGAPIWRDSSDITAETLSHPFGLDGAAAMGTIVCVAPNAETIRDAIREKVASVQDTRIGATVLGPMLLIRFIGRDAAATRERFQSVWADLRHVALGRPARLPPLVHC